MARIWHWVLEEYVEATCQLSDMGKTDKQLCLPAVVDKLMQVKSS